MERPPVHEFDNKESLTDASYLIKQIEMFELIFDSIYNGVMVTDPRGYVTHFNRPYGAFLGVIQKADRKPLHRGH